MAALTRGRGQVFAALHDFLRLCARRDGVAVKEADGFFQLAGKISGGDPGYDETAKMVAEAAVCLATQSAPPSRGGGFMTPATALGAPLRERLHVQGIRFEDMPVP